ncbi:MAG: KEOPS complex subunit Cgi121 [Candidatus Nezhaarchaeales archaeon]
MSSIIARDLLQKLLHERDELHVTVTHVKLASEVDSHDLINVIENLTKDLSLLWAVSRPGIPTSHFHVLHAFYQALKAFASNKNISNKFNIEFLLRLTCEDQIAEALRIAGLSKKTKSFCLYSISPNSMALETLLSRLASLFKELIIDSPSCCYGDDLLLKLKIGNEELTSTNYRSSVLSPKLKSILTRMSLLNVKR